MKTVKLKAEIVVISDPSCTTDQAAKLFNVNFPDCSKSAGCEARDAR
jgi:hypothetical protein